MRFILLALALLIIDQWSKWAVMSRMYHGESIPIIDRFFYMTYVQNPGAAFGMLPYKTAFFIIVTIAVILGIIIFIRHIPKDKVLLKAGLALQVGGALGNLIDRVRFGYVIDFFDFRVWPVFNIADIAICLGVGVLFIELMRGEQKEIVKNDECEHTVGEDSVNGE